MAVNLTLSQNAQAAALAAVIALVEAAGPAKVRIYSGTKPLNPLTTPPVDAVLLAELTLPAFAQPPGQDSAGLSTLPAAQGAVATGTAAWFRITNGSSVGVLDGTAGVGVTFAMMLNTVNFVVGIQVNVASLTLRVPPLG